MICSVCKEDKSEDCFAIRNKRKGSRQAYCKLCQKIYRREHYLNNKDKYLTKAKKWRDAHLETFYEYIITYLTSHPCVDCGETDVRVLEFDHRDPIEKSFTISDTSVYRSLEVIRKEIDKCDVRCANCHRIKTIQSYNGPYKRTYLKYFAGMA